MNKPVFHPGELAKKVLQDNTRPINQLMAQVIMSFHSATDRLSDMAEDEDPTSLAAFEYNENMAMVADSMIGSVLWLINEVNELRAEVKRLSNLHCN
jgi:hypothetical protein